MAIGRLTWQAAALLPAGSFAVHHLRYHLGSLSGSSATHHHGHAELSVMAPIATVLLLGWITHVVMTALRPAVSLRRIRFRTLWLWASLALLAIYGGQETIEGLLMSGHPDGPAGAFGGSGWLAVPLSVAVGALCAGGVQQARHVASSPSFLRLSSPRLALPVATAQLVWLGGQLVVPSGPDGWRCSGRGPPRRVCSQLAR
ncbi:MAG: hypothetical protein AB7G37_01645 [Solirubrobacteraceae bacterium]